MTNNIENAHAELMRLADSFAATRPGELAITRRDALEAYARTLTDSITAMERAQTYYSEYANVQSNEALRYQKSIRELEAQLEAVGAGGVGTMLPRHAQPAPAMPVPWVPGPNEFKDWCSRWFGPDADDSYLAKAAFDLPPTAQQFERPAAPQPQQIAEPASQTLVMDTHRRNGLAWAVAQWESEVKNRPMVNVHRRNLDGTWRQVVRYFDGDPDALLSPSHDDLLSANAAQRGHNPKEPS